MTGPGFANRLRTATAALHVRAERRGIVAALLHGRAGPAGHALLLRNLLPVYVAVETGLAARAALHPWLTPFVAPGFHRAGPIAADLATLAGDDWAGRLPLLPSGLRYARRVALAVAAGDDGRLLAHAYVRVLGDLSGGQVLARTLARRYGLPPSALQALSFPSLPDLAAARQAWRAALDAVGPHLPDPPAALREAQVAFRLNIALGEAVEQAMPMPSSAGDHCEIRMQMEWR